MKKKSIILLMTVFFSYANAKDISCSLSQENCNENGITYLPVRKVSSINDLDKSERFLLEDNSVKTGEVIDRRESIKFNSLEPIKLEPIIIDDKKKVNIKKEKKKEINSDKVDYVKNPPALQLHSKNWNELANTMIKEENKEKWVAKKLINKEISKNKKDEVKLSNTIAKKRVNEIKSNAKEKSKKNKTVSTNSTLNKNSKELNKKKDVKKVERSKRKVATNNSNIKKEINETNKKKATKEKKG